MYECEKRFANILESQNKTFISQPKKFKLENTTYRADFYCPENDTYYEVVGSEAAFYQSKFKMKEFIIKYPNIKFKIVYPSGKEYINKENLLKIKPKKSISKRKKYRFSFWLNIEDKMKLESMAKVDDLPIGYLIRKAIKEYIKENYAKAMVEITAKRYAGKLIETERKNKTKPLTKSQQKQLRVGVRERQKIRKQKEQRRRDQYYR